MADAGPLLDDGSRSERKDGDPSRLNSATTFVWRSIADGAQKYTFAKYFNQASSYFALGVVTLHILVGVLFFCLYAGEDWTFIDSLYFCVVTLTTVGYGDKDPETDVGKIFIAIYVLVGLGIVFNFLNSIMQGLWDSHEKFVVGLFDDDDDDENETKGKQDSLEEPSLGIFVVACCALLFIFSLGLVVGIVLEGWSFLDSFYFVCISATTVGYGDVHPSTNGMKIFCVFWLLFLTLGLGNVISEYQTYQLSKVTLSAKKRILQKRWTRSDFKKYDRDGDGAVGEKEFILSALIDMGIAKESEINAIVARFRERDADKSGDISMRDIATTRGK